MAQQTISPTTQQTGIFNSLVPPEGPKAVSVMLDFSAATSFLLDFTQAYEKTVLSVVQTLWCDNSANADDISFVVSGTNQSIVVPAGAQGTFPVVSAVRTKMTAVTASTAVVKCLFLNVPLPLGVWFPVSGGGSSVTIADQPIAVTISNMVVPVVIAETANVTASDPEAFAVVTGGTPVTVFPGGSVHTAGIITNPYSATESLFVDVVNSAQDAAPGSNGTTVELKAGDSFQVPGGLTNNVTANAATTGHAFTAWSY